MAGVGFGALIADRRNNTVPSPVRRSQNFFPRFAVSLHSAAVKAAILYGKEDVRIEDLRPAQLKPGEVRVRIEAALTCGTDLKVFRRGYHARMIVPPAVFGHELSGVITEVTSQANGNRGWQV